MGATSTQVASAGASARGRRQAGEQAGGGGATEGGHWRPPAQPAQAASVSQPASKQTPLRPPLRAGRAPASRVSASESALASLGAATQV